MTDQNSNDAEHHFLLRTKKSGVAFLFFDSPGKQNFLTHAVISDLARVLERISSDSAISAVVLISGKGNTFVAGADLHEILKYQTAEDATRLSEFGNRVFAMLANLAKPTVAAINGLCVGGGLELALCCDRRIATNAPITVLGLPEVSHGLIPGLGGTQRLPRLIGAAAAIELIVGSDLFDAQRAYDLKIVDEVVTPDDLLKRAEHLALELVQPDTSMTGEASQPSVDQLKKLFALWRRSVRLKTKNRYPAKLKVLDAIEEGLLNGFDRGIAREISTFAELAIGEVARNLIFLFFTKELAKQLAFKEARQVSSAKLSDFKVFDYEDTPAITGDLKTASGEKLFQLASELQTDEVLAVLTSTDSINDLVETLPNKENIVGLQYFHPVEQIKLVEVIPHKTTCSYARALAVKSVLKSKKLPVIVSDSPGFLLNRIVAVYLQHAEKLALSGTPVNWIEKSLTDFGMPIGPFAMIDEIGLSRAAAIVTNLRNKLGERFFVNSTIFKALELGMQGRKAGCGTYLWQNDERQHLNPDLQIKLNLKISEEQVTPEHAEKIAHRVILPMVDEAARCLEERIVRRPREIDLCLVLGIGFPAFRGGLLKYADWFGIKELIAEINEIYQETSPISPISDYLMKLEREKRGFYSRATD
ncbi:MAG: enoyl-CoA hydratase/isomerase family protein [Cyanobacteria bacterium SZAS LIN-5]|nr:enoyl-CoA hydratase/isomerase family protein [Cyanobacteria bacterium SZAS LIN-5]